MVRQAAHQGPEYNAVFAQAGSGPDPEAVIIIVIINVIITHTIIHTNYVCYYTYYYVC